MKWFLVSQKVNNDYDTFDSFVVAAVDAEQARNFVPDLKPWDLKEGELWEAEEFDSVDDWTFSMWTRDKSKIEARELGVCSSYTPAGTIAIASFNAG